MLTSSLLLPLIMLYGSSSLTVRPTMHGRMYYADTIVPVGGTVDSLYIISLLKDARGSSVIARAAIDSLQASLYKFYIHKIKKGISGFTGIAGHRAYYWHAVELGLHTPKNKDSIGCGGDLSFNPDSGYLFTTAGERRDILMNFLHELIGHAWVANYGLMRYGYVDGLEIAEWQATHWENRLRAEAEKPLREFYFKAPIPYGRKKVRFVGSGPPLIKDGRWSVYVPCYDYFRKILLVGDSCLQRVSIKATD